MKAWNKSAIRTPALFGRLLVEREHDRPYIIPSNGKAVTQYVCLCLCGNTVIVRQPYLKSGHTRSCGCLRRDSVITHGKAKTKAYRSWVAMKQRCSNPKARRFAEYGGRGISVCERWKDSFENFLADMGEPPTSKHSIDRIDVNGNYEPGNCRWATILEQAQNTRTNRNITFHGKTQSLSVWARELGIEPHTLIKRLNKWPLETALTTPCKRQYRTRKARKGAIDA